MRENDVTPSNVIEMKTDVTGPCGDLLQKFSVASHAVLELHGQTRPKHG